MYNFQPEPHNMYNMDEKGFLLGLHSQANVIVRYRHRPPIEKMDGSREWVTVVECTCGDNSILPPPVICKGKGHAVAGLRSRQSECKVCTL